EISTGSASQGWMEIVGPFRWAGLVPFAWIMSVQRDHGGYGYPHRTHPTQPNPPFDAWSGQPMQNVEPNRHERRDHMRPVGGRAQSRIFQIKHAANAHQRNARKEQEQADCK